MPAISFEKKLAINGVLLNMMRSSKRMVRSTYSPPIIRKPVYAPDRILFNQAARAKDENRITISSSRDNIKKLNRMPSSRASFSDCLMENSLR
jgi:hypothetical protein